MLQPLDEQFRRVFDALLDRVHAELRNHAADTVEELVSVAREGQHNAAVEAGRQAAAEAEQIVTARLTDAFAAREAAVREQTHGEGFQAGLERGRSEAAAAIESRLADAELAARAGATQDVLGRLVSTIRSLDNAGALSETLDALVSAVRGEAGRVGLFLLRNGALRAWGRADFAAHDQLMTSVALDEAGVVADAARSGSPHITTASDEWPAFAGAPSGGVLVAVPLLMNGEVIAVLCAEHRSAEEGTRLALTCELLARHAARSLESLTARRLAQTGVAAGAAAS